MCDRPLKLEHGVCRLLTSPYDRPPGWCREWKAARGGGELHIYGHSVVAVRASSRSNVVAFADTQFKSLCLLNRSGAALPEPQEALDWRAFFSLLPLILKTIHGLQLASIFYCQLLRSPDRPSGKLVEDAYITALAALSFRVRVWGATCVVT